MKQSNRIGPAPIEKFYRAADLVGPRGILPFGKSTLWAWVKDGRFPKPHKLGPRVSAWTHTSIMSFLAEAQTDSACISRSESHGAPDLENRLPCEKASAR